MDKPNKLKSVLKWIKSYFSIQKSKEAYCARHGHAWINDFDGKKLKQRIYCTRCHQKYHEHEYHVYQIGKNISK